MRNAHQRYYPALDGLRAVAVLLVFTCHYLADAIPGLRNWGFAGVDLFFVLSGFLITGILFDGRNESNRFRNFYGRRILRIWPLYYGTWAVLLFSEPILHWKLEPGIVLWLGHLGNWARFVFYDPAHIDRLDYLARPGVHRFVTYAFFGHFWSLCIEEQFYLLWPILVFTIKSRRRLLQIAVALILAEPALRFCLWLYGPKWVIDGGFLIRSTITRLDGMMIGGALALLQRGPSSKWIAQNRRLVTLALLFPVVVFYVEYRHRTHDSYANLADVSLSTIGFSTFGLVGAAAILELTRREGLLSRALSLKPFLFLGSISYGFYVFHDLPHDMYSRFGGHFRKGPTQTAFITAAVALTCTLILSYLSFRFFETPFLRLKRFFPGEAGGHPPPQVDSRST